MRWKNQRLLAMLVVAIAVAALAIGHRLIADRLGHASYYSGATLLACVLLLALLGVRKRVPMLPIFRVAVWTRIHVYTGWFTLAAYLFHVPSVIANGIFEGGLSLLFLAVAISGVYGVYISRVAPRKMNAVPGEFRFDRISWHRQRLADRASQLLADLEVSIASPVLASYYRDSLRPYFSSNVAFSFIVVPNSMRRQRMLLGLREMDRYLCDKTRSVAGQLAALIRKRDELDFHYAMQLRLRVWVAWHAALSLVLLGWCLTHVALVLIFI